MAWREPHRSLRFTQFTSALRVLGASTRLALVGAEECLWCPRRAVSLQCCQFRGRGRIITIIP